MKKEETLREHLASVASDFCGLRVETIRTEHPEWTETKIKKAAARSLGVSIATLYRTIDSTPGAAEGSGKVYLMRHSCGAHKIGFTCGNPIFRESTLQAEDPRVSLAQWWFGGRADEAALHTLFASKRTRGEWFDLSPDDLARLREYMRARKRAAQMNEEG